MSRETLMTLIDINQNALAPTSHAALKNALARPTTA
jgi:hypothetical protein